MKTPSDHLPKGSPTPCYGDSIPEIDLKRAHDAHTQFLADLPPGLPGPRIPLEAMRMALAAAPLRVNTAGLAPEHGEAAQLRDLLADALRHLEQDTAYHQTVGRDLLAKSIALVDALFGAPDPRVAYVRIGIEITANRIAITARESAGFQRAAASRVWHHDHTFPPRSAWRSQQAAFGERTSSAQRLGPALVEYLDDLLELPTRVADQLPVPPAGGA